MPPGGCGTCQWVAGIDGAWHVTAPCLGNCICAPIDIPISYCGQTGTSACWVSPPVGTTPPPPTVGPCRGTCIWYASFIYNGYPPTLTWLFNRLGSTCSASFSYPDVPVSGSWGCGCACPLTPPSSICDIAETQCMGPPRTGIGFPIQACDEDGYVECACCTTQPCDKYCSFKGNGTGGWTKIDDPCPTTCPCPQYPATESISDCDLRQYRCGSVVPTTQTTTTTGTTTSTTTPGPGACCYGDGTCSYGPYSQCVGIATFQGAGVLCENVTCPTTTTANPIGSCCVGSGNVGTGTNCIGNVNRSYCSYLGGQFHQGVSCSNLPPSAACYSSTTTTTNPSGRCCAGIPLTCFDRIAQADCSLMGGTWGAGTCASNPCPTTTTTTTTTTVTTQSPPLNP